MGSENRAAFPVKWQNHEANMRNAFDQLLLAQAFVDVTLVCNDICVKVHKTVLSTASPYLQNILLQNPCEHPVIILQDVDELALQCLVTFMYKGEVAVPPKNFESMMRCARALKIQGFLDACAKNSPCSDGLTNSGQVEDEINETEDSLTIDTVDADTGNSEMLLPVDLVDISMQNDDSSALDESSETCLTRKGNPHVKRNRGRPRKPRTSTSEPCSSKAADRNDDSRGLELDSNFANSSESLGLGLASPAVIKRERLSEEGHQDEQSWSNDPDASQNYSTKLNSSHKDNLDLKPLSPSSFSSGLEGGLRKTPKRKARSPEGPIYRCVICGKEFGRKHHLIQHLKIHDPARDTYHCELCRRVYHRRSELVRHQKTSHLDSNSNSN